jgi:hypothetical protein
MCPCPKTERGNNWNNETVLNDYGRTNKVTFTDPITGKKYVGMNFTDAPKTNKTGLYSNARDCLLKAEDP